MKVFGVNSALGFEGLTVKGPQKRGEAKKRQEFGPLSDEVGRDVIIKTGWGKSYTSVEVINKRTQESEYYRHKDARSNHLGNGFNDFHMNQINNYLHAQKFGLPKLVNEVFKIDGSYFREILITAKPEKLEEFKEALGKVKEKLGDDAPLRLACAGLNHNHATMMTDYKGKTYDAESKERLATTLLVLCNKILNEEPC